MALKVRIVITLEQNELVTGEDTSGASWGIRMLFLDIGAGYLQVYSLCKNSFHYIL